MKGRLKRDIKEFFAFTIGIGIFGLFCWALCVIVGYVAFQLFDLAIYTGYVSSALSYYGTNGVGILFILLVGAGTLALVGIPIYKGISYFIDNGISWKSVRDIFLECE